MIPLSFFVLVRYLHLRPSRCSPEMEADYSVYLRRGEAHRRTTPGRYLSSGEASLTGAGAPVPVRNLSPNKHKKPPLIRAVA